MKNKVANALFRGLINYAGQAIVGVIVAGVLGAAGIDTNENYQTDSQDESDLPSENTNV